MPDQFASPELERKASPPDVALVCFTIAIYAGVGLNFLGILPSGLATVLCAVSIFAGFFGILTHAATGRSSVMFVAWLIVVVYMMVIGAARSNLYELEFNAWVFFFQDLRYVMYFAIGIILASPKYLPHYHRLMVSLAGFAVVAGLAALFFFEFDTGRVLEGERLGVWGPSYYLWWLSVGVFAYMYPYARLVRRDRWRGYAAFAAYGVLGLLFMKRSVVVNLVFVVLATEMAASYLARGRLFAVPTVRQFSRGLVAAPIILGSVHLLTRTPYVQALTTSLSDRFGGDSGRGLEASTYFDGVSLGEIISGQGIGHYTQLSYSDGSVAVFDLSVNALHIGLLNTVYKGGLIYLSFMVVIIFSVFSYIFQRPRVTPYLAVCLVTSFSFILSLFYEMTWAYTPIIIGYATPLTYAVQHSRLAVHVQQPIGKR